MTRLDLNSRFAVGAGAGPQFAPAAADVLVIEPQRGWRSIDFGELWRYRVPLNQSLDWNVLGISLLVSSILLTIGVANFRRTERRFADIV